MIGKEKIRKAVYLLSLLIIIYLVLEINSKDKEKNIKDVNDSASIKQMLVNKKIDDITTSTKKNNVIINSNKNAFYSIPSQIEKTDDLFDLALKLLDRAKAGDAESQYYLFKTLEYCDYYSKFNIDYVLTYLYQRQGINPNLKHIKILEQQVMRCSGFNQENSAYFESNDKTDWLEKSAKSGVVLAMAEYAKNTLEYNNHMNSASTSAVDNLSVSKLKEASKMLFDSIENGEGEVYFNVAQIINNNKYDQLAWSLLACRTGMNCSDKSWNLNREMAVSTCLITKPAMDCYDKADSNYLINLGSTPDEIKEYTARSYEIEQHIKNKNFRGIGLDQYLGYLDKD